MTLFDYLKDILSGRSLKMIKSLLTYSFLTLFLGACSAEANDETLKNIYNSKKGSYSLTTRHLDENQQPVFVNRLVKQNSLYLLQHANNPVQWWAWGDEAFAKAKELNKPIFLSIGYSTCHWCHVMARESFEDIEIANFINDNFIPIKVDREEYPDVDELYLTSVQMLSGKAGWPLTAILTPDGQAFFGGTYFKPATLLNLLNKVNDTWLNRKDAVLEQAGRLTDSLRAINRASANTKLIDDVVISEAEIRIRDDLSRSLKAPASKTKPGFPREPEMLFLLNQARRNLSKNTIETVTQRLLELAAGGIHDQVGGGFHRYTVDSKWVIPHFEKMLYNQAQMGQSYFRGYQLTGNPTLKAIGDKTFAFLLNEMQAPEGGFYAAMDAESDDSNGIKGEGDYYLWTHQELSSLLTKKELSLATLHLGVTTQGNFNGQNVLQNHSFRIKQAQASPKENTQTQQLQEVISKLATARGKRKPPQTDTKLITAWNSMAISGLTTAYSATENNVYLNAAKNAANRIWEQSYDAKKGLSRTVPTKNQRVIGTLEDYAYFANALLDLHDADGDVSWLTKSVSITEVMINRFHDTETGGFQISSSSDKKTPLMKLVTARDDAIYSGNSVAAQVLARLYQRTGKLQYKNTAAGTISAFSNQLLANPEALSGMLLAANNLNNGVTGNRQYAAKGNIVIESNIDSTNRLVLDMHIAEGWHTNASNVLNDYLIATTLTAPSSSSDSACPTLNEVSYPKGHLVSLGFQEDKLLVYEDQTSLTASLTLPSNSNCRIAAAVLNIQACTDQVCLAPEKVQIRAQRKPI